jgi:hypothetical protein
MITNRTYGFHSTDAALATTVFTCGPVTLDLSHHTGHFPHSCQQSRKTDQNRRWRVKSCADESAPVTVKTPSRR